MCRCKVMGGEGGGLGDFRKWNLGLPLCIFRRDLPADPGAAMATPSSRNVYPLFDSRILKTYGDSSRE